MLLPCQKHVVIEEQKSTSTILSVFLFTVYTNGAQPPAVRPYAAFIN